MSCAYMNFQTRMELQSKGYRVLEGTDTIQLSDSKGKKVVEIVKNSEEEIYILNEKKVVYCKNCFVELSVNKYYDIPAVDIYDNTGKIPIYVFIEGKIHKHHYVYNFACD